MQDFDQWGCSGNKYTEYVDFKCGKTINTYFGINRIQS